MNLSEQQFAKYLTTRGFDWVYEPFAFSLNVPRPVQSGNRTYRPDFFCPDNNTYYEVSATRQAHSQSMVKIKLLKKLHPNMKIRVVNPDGTPYQVRPLFPQHECKRCGHRWVPRTEEQPLTCPNCRSPYWDRPRKNNQDKTNE